MRRVHEDKHGLYIVVGRRKFRPSVNSVSGFTKGDAAYVQASPHGNVQTCRVYRYGSQVSATPTLDEMWATTDEDPRPMERLKQGWHQFTAKVSRGHLTVVVAADNGYDYGMFRRQPSGYKPHISRHSTVGINVHLHVPSGTAGHVQLTWAEWDALVEEVNAERETVQIVPLAAQLQEEIQAVDEMQAYIEKKGLA